MECQTNKFSILIHICGRLEMLLPRGYYYVSNNNLSIFLSIRLREKNFIIANDIVGMCFVCRDIVCVLVHNST